MLILTRKLEEEINIGGLVTIKVVQIRGDQVKLGISAPREIVVHRAEIAERIKAGEKRVDNRD